MFLLHTREWEQTGNLGMEHVTYRFSLYGFFACVLVHTLVGVAWKNVTSLTSSCGRSIERVGTVMKFSLGCQLQYQLLSTCIEQRYCALTTNYP